MKEPSRELIVAIGDSITYGFPYSSEHSWVAQIVGKHSLNIMNVGSCGDTTLDMRFRFHRDVLRFSPSFVIIFGGANDALIGLPVGDAVDNIKEMVDLAKQHGIIPIVGVPIPCNFSQEEEWLTTYRKSLAEYIKTAKIDTIDFYTPLLDESGFGIKEGLHTDGIHPSKAGYKIMAKAAGKSLSKFF